MVKLLVNNNIKNTEDFEKGRLHIPKFYGCQCIILQKSLLTLLAGSETISKVVPYFSPTTPLDFKLHYMKKKIIFLCEKITAFSDTFCQKKKQCKFCKFVKFQVRLEFIDCFNTYSHN